jgi:hypothetical protein
LYLGSKPSAALAMPAHATIALHAKERTAGAIDLDMLISYRSLLFP